VITQNTISLVANGVSIATGGGTITLTYNTINATANDIVTASLTAATIINSSYNWLRSAGDNFGKENIELSRSRPGKSNDNMYVEERNGHVIRKSVGYLRLDCRESVDALNELSVVLTPYLMHFVAVRRTREKEKIQSQYRRM
jgi:hypothetical protein